MEVAPHDPRSNREGGSLERADLVGQVCGSTCPDSIGSPHGPAISGWHARVEAKCAIQAEQLSLASAETNCPTALLGVLPSANK